MSKLVEWSGELSVGIHELDEQHKILFNLLNHLHDTIVENRGSGAACRALNDFAEYMRTHFSVEESLMRILNFPAYEEHRHEHEIVMEQMNDVQRKLDAGGHSIGFELLHFLKIWLTKHILEWDKAYAPHFLGCGINSCWKDSSGVGKLWGSKGPFTASL